MKNDIDDVRSKLMAARTSLESSITLTVQMRHALEAQQAQLKVVEDSIIAEIWADERYKNDKARNEQKHLARINDNRYIAASDLMQQLEIQKARAHADVMRHQTDVDLAMLEYELVLLGRRDERVRIVQQLIESENADTTKDVTTKTNMIIGADNVDGSGGSAAARGLGLAFAADRATDLKAQQAALNVHLKGADNFINVQAAVNRAALVTYPVRDRFGANIEDNDFQLAQANLFNFIVSNGYADICPTCGQYFILVRGAFSGTRWYHQPEVIVNCPVNIGLWVMPVEVLQADRFPDYEGGSSLDKIAKAGTPSLRDQLAAGMSADKIAELTTDQTVEAADPNAKIVGNSNTTVGEAQAERNAQNAAPYLKESSNKKVEKVGNVRI